MLKDLRKAVEGFGFETEDAPHGFKVLLGEKGFIKFLETCDVFGHHAHVVVKWEACYFGVRREVRR